LLIDIPCPVLNNGIDSCASLSLSGLPTVYRPGDDDHREKMKKLQEFLSVQPGQHARKMPKFHFFPHWHKPCGRRANKTIFRKFIDNQTNPLNQKKAPIWP
jgi:hypothetical protein